MTNRRNEKYHEFTMKIARPGPYVRSATLPTKTGRHHWCSTVNFRKFLGHLFCRTASRDCYWYNQADKTCLTPI